MRNLFCVLVVIVGCFEARAQKGTNPDKSTFPFHYVYKYFEKSNDQVTVRKSGFKKTWGGHSFRSNLGQMALDHQWFEMEQKVGASVFKVTREEGHEQVKIHFGTAFYVGNDMALTNLHVLGRDNPDLTYCPRLKMRLPAKSMRRYTFTCEKVLFCSSQLDVCLLKLKIPKGLKRRKGIKALDDQLDPIQFHVLDLATLGQDFHAGAFGNPQGYGIQASWGKGLRKLGHRLIHHASLYHGNSGGPLVDEQGRSVGVVYAMSGGLLVGPKVRGYASDNRELLSKLAGKLGKNFLSKFQLSSAAQALVKTFKD